MEENHKVHSEHYEDRLKAVKEMLKTINGEHPERDGLKETPRRVAEMWDELFDGYNEDPKTILSTCFEEDHKEMIIEKDISFNSTCEHHIVPFMGLVHIGYIPNGKILGFSKFARLVDCFAHRLQVQERLTSQIADAIWTILKPLGVIVVVEAQHLCICIRGAKNPTVKNITSAVRGVFLTHAEPRTEFLTLIGRK